MVAEWFGQTWQSTGRPESSAWKSISDSQRPGPVSHIQTALFAGTGSKGLGRDEVVIAGYGMNNEWVFRANGHLGWLLIHSTNKSSFSGLIEFIMDDDGVAQPLIPFKHFKLNPDVESFANAVDYSTAHGKQLHRNIGLVKRVDTANTILHKRPAGNWERRPLPLELQVAPIHAAVVIPTPEGAAWLITFKETDGHRIFGSPAQRWPAIVYWPSGTGRGGKCLPAADLGFAGLAGDAELVVTGESPLSAQILAVWSEGGRCSIYSVAVH
jgi:hypothetical protein